MKPHLAPARASFVTGLMLVVAAAISWGCWSLFLRPCGMPAALTAPIAMFVMGLTLLPMRRLDAIVPTWDRTSLGLLAGLALCDAVNMGAFFAAMDVTTLGVSVLAHYLAPLLVALAAPCIDGERVPGARAAVVVGTLGLALVLEPWRPDVAGGNRMLGAALGALSAVGYAGNVFIAMRLVPRVGAARSVGYHSFLSALLLLPFVPLAAWGTATPRGLGLLVFASITLGAIAGWMFSRGLVAIGPTLGSTLAFLEPLVAVLLGWLAWSERLSPIAAAGAFLILGAGAWITRSRAKAAR